MDESGEARVFEQETDLRETMGETMEISVKKCIPSLDKHCKDFISRSPFLCIGTSGENGRADVSPRGERPGVLQGLAHKTVFIPAPPRQPPAAHDDHHHRDPQCRPALSRPRLR
ncbi:MAG: pyridoxamine 5'-phosphate oxidase family protein [Rhodospirillaceae bacterium]|nr:pyridoxamine 5'-phosphate oxidase family protein [Rhodospirillaceae bacterium]